MSTSPSVIRRFVEYYAGLDAQPPAALAALYHPDATLSDPFGQHQGLFAIQRYFTHLLANVEQCRFTIDTPLCDGQRFAVIWTMHWSHPRIAGGETLPCRAARWWTSPGSRFSISATTTTPGR